MPSCSSKNLFHAVLWLALALTGTAGVFLLLDAEFLAAVQLLLYAGGIVTIVVFAIVVTERLVGERISQTNRASAGGAVVVGRARWAHRQRVIGSGRWRSTRPPMAEDLTQVDRRDGADAVRAAVRAARPADAGGALGAIYFARPED